MIKKILIFGVILIVLASGLVLYAVINRQNKMLMIQKDERYRSDKISGLRDNFSSEKLFENNEKLSPEGFLE